MQDRFTAFSVYLDISGFTALTTTIMEHDQADGGEIVSDLMREVFSPLTRLVDQYGGFISGFAGDSLVALFPFENETQESVVAHRAVTAAWLMQQSTQNTSHTTPAGDFTFTIRIGVGRGEIKWRIFQNQANLSKRIRTQRSLYIFHGSALDQSVTAEAHCPPNEIVLAADVHNTLPSNLAEVSSIQNQPSFVQLIDIAHHARLDLTVQSPLLTIPPKSVQAFVPPALRSANRRGEFRQVISLFIHILYDGEELDELDGFVDLIYELQAVYGGYVNSIRYGDKGCTAVIFFGAPIAYEKDTENGIQFAYRLNQRSPYTLRIGASYRWSYAGRVGGESRFDYSSYGGGTSLAARLATSAPAGEIWIDEELATRIGHLFELKPMGSRPFKGFSRPIRYYQVNEPTQQALLPTTRPALEHQLPFVGRDPEITNAKSWVSQHLENKSLVGTYIIQGDAGSGKSRLIQELHQHLITEGISLAWYDTQCDERAQTELQLIRTFLQRYFNQSPEYTDEQNKAAFTSKFDQLMAERQQAEMAAELNRTRSFIAALIGLYWADTLYQQVDPQLRQRNLQSGLSAFFRALCHNTQLFWHIEDAHWIDPATIQFINRLLADLSTSPQTHNLCILITTRIITHPDADPLLTPVKQVAYSKMVLGSLGTEETTQLAENLIQRPITAHFSEFLNARTGGNPFFIEQTLLYLREMNLLIDHDGLIGVGPGKSTISADIRTVILARIDRLIPEVQDTVQTAAVLGQEFSLNLLRHMLASDDQLDSHVRTASESTIWIELQELRYLFKHAILRDVAYQMQLRSRRQKLHQLAFDAILALYQADLTPYYGELAFHAELANQIEAAIEYLQKAGDAAAEGYQNKSALNFYGRSHDLLQNNPSPANDEKRFHLLIKIANVQNLISDYQTARATANEALGLARTLQSLPLIMTVFQLQADVGRHLNRNDVGLSYLAHVLAFHRSQGNRAEMAQALDLIGLIHWTKEHFSAALGNLAEALKLINKEKYPLLFAKISLALGMCHLDLDDYEPARNFFTEASKIFLQINDLSHYTATVESLALQSKYEGKFDASYQYYEEAVALAKQIGWQQIHMRLLSNIGHLMTKMARYQDAKIALEQSLQMAITQKGSYAQCWIHAYRTEFFIAQNQYQEAQTANTASLKFAEIVNSRVFRIRGKLNRAIILQQLNQVSAANQVLDEVAELALTESQTADLAYTKWIIQEDMQAATEALHFYENALLKADKREWVEKVTALKTALPQ